MMMFVVPDSLKSLNSPAGDNATTVEFEITIPGKGFSWEIVGCGRSQATP